MTSKKVTGFRFWLKTAEARYDGMVPIYARITVNGKRTEISLKEFAQAQHWCGKAQRLDYRADGAGSLNDKLDAIQANLLDCRNQLRAEGKLVTAMAIKLRYLKKDNTVVTLLELIAYHRNNCLKLLAPGTAKNYNATETYLSRFLRKVRNCSDVPLTQIDYAFIIAFESYLRACPPIRKCQPLNNNGIMKHLERFNKMMGLATKFGWIKRNPFVLHSLRFEEYEAAFLEKNELDYLATFDLDHSGHQRVRDVFMFSCYTGLSYIEVRNLKKTDIVTGIDGEEWISVRRQKTKTVVKVPLLEQAKAILERYSEHPKETNGFVLLPVYTDQKINKYLKVIASSCGIHKNLTFHVARHTFATTVTLLNDVPLETVSKMLGHTKLSTTQRYARVVEKKISKDMAVLKQKLKGNQPDYIEPESNGSSSKGEQNFQPLRLVR